MIENLGFKGAGPFGDSHARCCRRRRYRRRLYCHMAAARGPPGYAGRPGRTRPLAHPTGMLAFSPQGRSCRFLFQG